MKTKWITILQKYGRILEFNATEGYVVFEANAGVELKGDSILDKLLAVIRTREGALVPVRIYLEDLENAETLADVMRAVKPEKSADS